MCLSLLTYSGGTDRPVELCYNFSISNDLTALLFWIYFFLLTLVFVQQWLSLHQDILIMLLIQFPLTACQTLGFPVLSHSFWLFFSWLGWSLWSFDRCSMGGYLLNFVSGFRLQLMHISLLVSISSGLTHLHGFQLLVLLS